MEPLSLVSQVVAPYVGESGKNPIDPDVLVAINEARRIIYPVGDWKDTIDPLALEIHHGTVTLPSGYTTIRKAWHGRHNIEIESHWYSVLDYDGFSGMCGQFIDDGMIDLGDRFATFLPYPNTFRLKVISLNRDDVGARLVFHAVSEYGEPLSLTRILGQPWTPIISDPVNDKWVKSVSYCIKPVTADRVLVSVFDPVRRFEQLAAIYEAGDVNPHYRRYRIPRYHHGRSRCLLVKAKKRYADLVNQDQLVDIQTDALIHLLQAVTARRNRDLATYAQQVGAAKNLLDVEIKDNQPMRTTNLKMSKAFRVTNLGFGDEAEEFYPPYYDSGADHR